VAGKAKLYGAHFLTGASALQGGVRSIDIGEGIPSDVVITLTKDGKLLFGKVVVGTSNNPGSSSDSGVSTTITSTNMLYWKDRRIE
jgi:hypothetical protein